MGRNYNIYENDEYKFVKFSDILKDIRDTFLEEVLEYEMQTRTRNKLLRHSAIIEVLKSYIHVNPMKTNAILISNDTHVNCGGLLNEDEFLEKVTLSIDKSKRMIPLLIKRVDCDFEELEDFLKTGEGKEFILHLESDKERLRKNACSFQEFKIFARNNHLKYIREIIDKKEFKCLFYS